MKNTLFLILASLILTSCQSGKIKNEPKAMTIKFDPVGGHLVKIPVIINGTIRTSFLLDTGAGVNVISERLCKQIQCRKSGQYTGKRMSGEELTLQFTSVPQITIGDLNSENMRAGVTDIFEKIPKALGTIDGAISLRFFESQVFTIDYKTSNIIFGNEAAGTAVPIKIERDHEQTIAFLEMADFGLFEVDTGNSIATLDLSKAGIAKVYLQSSNVKKVEGKSETGFPFTAYYTQIPELRTAVGDIKQQNPRIAFKKLIHAGVIGNDFFKERRVTFDLPSSEIRFQ